MPKRFLTVSVDEDLLLEASAIAARQHTSLNEMVRQYLESVVRKEQERLPVGSIRRPVRALDADFWERPRPLDPEGSVRKAASDEREGGW